ncbi:hypothetical protein AB0B31_26155 [Catellatospora citrea]|uniref:hypothetical protein n=1 Tax=Catellatospora citrea TaxID=53366 RepID=UPI0033F54894
MAASLVALTASLLVGAAPANAVQPYAIEAAAQVLVIVFAIPTGSVSAFLATERLARIFDH